MANVIRMNCSRGQDLSVGGIIVADVLLRMRALDGREAALRVAEEMIVAATEILCRERGGRAAEDVLLKAARTMHQGATPDAA